MYGIPDSVKPLSAAEEQVMLAVWACRAPATRRDIDEKLRAKGWAPATVLNFLYRLEEKGWVKSGKDGNRNTYTPAITQRAHRRRKVAAKEGVQPFPHTPHVVGALGDGRSVGLSLIHISEPTRPY